MRKNLFQACSTKYVLKDRNSKGVIVTEFCFVKWDEVMQ